MFPASWESIPEDLRGIGKWAIAAPDKSPWTVRGNRASINSPTSWTDWYSAAVTAGSWGAGIGFILTEDDEFSCIDLDVKEGTTQEDLDRYWRIVQAFGSYTEKSTSGKGLHIWVRGKVGTGCKRDGVEVYSQQRFIICTGNTINHKPIERRQELLDMLVSEMRRGTKTDIELAEVKSDLSDEELWVKAAGADNGSKFIQLWEGDWAGMGYPSQSEADLALLSMLAFYSKSNEQVRRVFRRCALGQRAKAVRNDTYLNYGLKLIRGRQEREEQVASVVKASSEQLIEKVRLQTEIEAPDVTAMDWPPGVVGDIAQWMYSIAPRPVREVAIVAALGFIAGIVGRSYNINNSGLNIYLVLVARSAIGKEAMHSGMSKLVNRMLDTCPMISNYIDFADYASGPALVKSLATRSSFCNVAGEWGRKLRKMADDHVEGPMASLRTVMTNLYQKSSVGTIVGGIGYSDKDKDIKSVNGVAYSMIGETTPDTFYESLTNTMMADGFLSRFIIIEYAGLRPELNPAQDNPLHPNLIEYLSNLVYTSAGQAMDRSIDIAVSKEAQQILDEFNLECDKQINSTLDEGWRQLWNRAHLKTLKLAGLLAVADNYGSPCVQLVHAEWALGLIRRDIQIMGRKIREGDVGEGDVVRERKMLTLIQEYLQTPIPSSYKLPEEMRLSGVIARKYLQTRLANVNAFAKHRLGSTAALDATVRSLVDSGYLFEIAKDKIPPEWGFTGKSYRIISLPDIR